MTKKRLGKLPGDDNWPDVFLGWEGENRNSRIIVKGVNKSKKEISNILISDEDDLIGDNDVEYDGMCWDKLYNDFMDFTLSGDSEATPVITHISELRKNYNQIKLEGIKQADAVIPEIHEKLCRKGKLPLFRQFSYVSEKEFLKEAKDDTHRMLQELYLEAKKKG